MSNKKLTVKPALVVVSDLHCGCQLALSPPEGCKLDNGNVVEQNRFQKLLWKEWEYFWKDRVPKFTRGCKFDVVINGDSVDGVHHNTTTQMTHNIEDQAALAIDIITRTMSWLPKGTRLYMVRGTDAHVGQSGFIEERIAKACGAIPDQDGRYARNRLRKYIANKKLKSEKEYPLIDLMHHIGSTGSMAYETTAILKELVDAFAEAGRWGERAPDCVVRSHRHRSAYVDLPADPIDKISCTTPGWQGKTPLVYRIAGARQSEPQFGGLVIISGDVDAGEDQLYLRRYVKSMKRERPE